MTKEEKEYKEWEQAYEKYEAWEKRMDAFISVLNILCLIYVSYVIIEGISMMAVDPITGFNLLLVGVAFYPGAIGLFIISRDYETA